jgi:PAS domain-containing protein
MNDADFDFTNARMLRKKAEERLQEKQSDTKLTKDEAGSKRLLHELQVHQIELEMQNEELRQANEMTEAALKKYTLLYDFAPMGYFILDEHATICDLNFSGAEMLGDKRHSLLNTNFKLFVLEESVHTFNKFFSGLYVSNAKDSCQLKLGYNNTPLGFVYMEGIVTRDDGKCLLSLIDITGIKKKIVDGGDK